MLELKLIEKKKDWEWFDEKQKESKVNVSMSREFGKVSGIFVNHLRLGAKYHGKLTDLITNTSQSFNFVACKY